MNTIGFKYSQSEKSRNPFDLGGGQALSSENHDAAVAYGINPQGGQNQQAVLTMRYIVRRLTPTECERLMGLPDGWTIPKNLEVTDALVEEFRIIHDNFKRIMAEYDGSPMPKPTSAAQVRKWLEKISNPDTCPDTPRYKGCGNGWATNQPRWILTRLLAVEGVEWSLHH
jgi:site-specific DNA-cytosine methylase